jgi:hypothetical protein
MTTTQLDLTAAVELARLAPSVHNSQPWRFRTDGGTLTVSRDPDRRLDVMDPTGRQQTLSCGAALHLARLALRQQGFDSQVVPFPALAGKDVVAHVVPQHGPSVRSEEVVLADAARHRHTQRGPFDPRPVPADVVAELRAAVQEAGAWLRVVDDPDDLATLTVLLSHAEEEEREDPAYLAELAAWTGRGSGAPDGLPLAAVPDVTGRASSLRLRDFDAAEPAPVEHPDEPPPVERPLVVVLGTEQDTPADWLTAGQALMALLLRATVEGVQAQPLGQVIDREWARARLGAHLGVVGHPQMVLRLGYGHPGADTPRRSVRNVLEG